MLNNTNLDNLISQFNNSNFSPKKSLTSNTGAANSTNSIKHTPLTQAPPGPYLSLASPNFSLNSINANNLSGNSNVNEQTNLHGLSRSLSGINAAHASPLIKQQATNGGSNHLHAPLLQTSSSGSSASSSPVIATASTTTNASTNNSNSAAASASRNQAIKTSSSPNNSLSAASSSSPSTTASQVNLLGPNSINSLSFPNTVSSSSSNNNTTSANLNNNVNLKKVFFCHLF